MDIQFTNDTDSILRITDKALREAYMYDNSNIVVSYLYANEGIYMVDVQSMFNALLVDSEETIYILKSPDDFILIDGEEVAFPDVLDVIDVSDLTPYVTDATEDEIRKYVSDYELNFKRININETAQNMLADGYDLRDIATDAEEIGLI